MPPRFITMEIMRAGMTNPEAYMIDKFIVDNTTKLQLKLAPGGGYRDQPYARYSQ